VTYPYGVSTHPCRRTPLLRNAANAHQQTFLERYPSKQPSEAQPATVSGKPAAQPETPFNNRKQTGHTHEQMQVRERGDTER
jgi:hypothetical protein